MIDLLMFAALSALLLFMIACPGAILVTAIYEIFR